MSLNKFDEQLVAQIVSAQNAKREAIHKANLERYPWLKGVRDAQKRLNESEAK